MAISTTSPPRTGGHLEDPTDRRPATDRGVLLVAALAVGVPVLATIEVLQPVNVVLAAVLLLLGPGHCVTVASGIRPLGLRLGLTLAVSTGLCVVVATALLYLHLWSVPLFTVMFGVVTLALAAAAVPRPSRPRVAGRFVALAVLPVVLGLAAGVLEPGPQDAPPAAQSRTDSSVSSPSVPIEQFTTARVWAVGHQWWALVWDDASGTYRFQRRTPANGQWRQVGLQVDAARGDAIDVLWTRERLIVLVAASSSDESPASLRAVEFLPNADGSSWLQDMAVPVTVAAGATSSPSLGRDGTGRFWASYVQEGRVWVTHTATEDPSLWVRPVPVSASAPADQLTIVDGTTLVRLREGRLGLLWSNGSSRRIFWATDLTAVDERRAPRVTSLGVPRANVGLVTLEAVSANGSGHVYLVAQGWARDARDEPGRPIRVLLSRDRDNRWRPFPVTVGDTVTGTALATDAVRRTLYVFVADRCCPRVPTSYLVTSMDDPVLDGPDTQGPLLPTAGSGLTRYAVRLTGGDAAAARMLRDDVLSPAPARAPSVEPTLEDARPATAAAPSDRPLVRVRDLVVSVGVLALLGLLLALLQAETAAARSDSVPRRGEALVHRLRPPRWVDVTLAVVACGVLLPRLWGLLT